MASIGHVSILGGGRGETTATQIMGVALSFGVHAAVVLAVVIGTMESEEAIQEQIEPKMIEFENVELLALGVEKKDPKMLPRIANPELPTIKEDAVNLAAKDKKIEEKKEKKDEKKKDKKERDQAMLNALADLHDPNRPTNDDLPEGSKEGIVGGTLTDAAMANLMNTYAVKLNKAIGKYWQVPTTIEESQFDGLAGKVKVYVRLSNSGKVVLFRFKSKSGNAQFDDSIDRVLQRFTARGSSTLPLPDNAEVRQEVIKQGLNLKGWAQARK